MITIVAQNTLKNGMKAKYMEGVGELIQASRAEAGCISYDLYEDIKDENTVTFIEFWKDQAAIDAHNSSPHFTRLVPALGEYVESSQVRLYQKADK